MNVAPAFFQLTEYSLQHTFMIELAKLYDDKRDKHNKIENKTGLRELLRQCEENKHLFLTEQLIDASVDCDTGELAYREKNTVSVLDDIKELKVEWDSKKPLLDSLRKCRNKWYAHLDYKYQIPERVEEAFPLTFGEVEELLEFAKKICNKLLADLNRGVFVTRSSNVHDVDELFERVEQGMGK